ncbi:MAG: hypothetical protein U0793_19585 [Gemmataceae bacterium]
MDLQQATVQEIQLELIRRTRFNAFDGPKIHDSLLRHRDLWIAVLFDQPGLCDYTRPGKLLTSGLIKLRDLDDNIWNVDRLFILTKSHADAAGIARVAEEEDWSADIVRCHTDEDEIGRALGTSERGFGVVTAWWD